MNKVLCFVFFIIANLASWNEICAQHHIDSLDLEWKNLSFEDRLVKCIYLSSKLEDKIISSGCLPGFIMCVGVKDAPIVLGERDINDSARGVVHNDTIYIFHSALNYPDKGISTIFHEFVGHLCPPDIVVLQEFPNEKDPEESDEMRREDSILREEFHFEIDLSEVKVIRPSINQLREEIVAYRLELELHNLKLIQLREVDLEKIKFNIDHHKFLLKNRLKNGGY